MPLLKENYDGFRVRLSPEETISNTQSSALFPNNESSNYNEWSDIGSISLLLEKNRSLCLQAKIHHLEDEKSESFFVTLRSEKRANNNIEIFIQYPSKIANYLPFPLKIRVKSAPYSENLEGTPRKEKKINWIFDKSLDINEILQDKKINGSKIGSKIFKETMDKEEEINAGCSSYSTLIDYNAKISISIQLPGFRWSEFLNIMGQTTGEKMNSGDSYYFSAKKNHNNNENEFFNQNQINNGCKEELFYFQNFNQANEQINVILEKKLENEISYFVFFVEYWLLNETPFPLLARIKEHNYQYQWMKVPDLWVNTRDKPLFSQNNFNGFSHLSGVSLQKEISINTLSNENNSFFIGSTENLEKIFFSLNASYFSPKDLKELLKKHEENLMIFSGNHQKINKKISFQIENLSSWSEYFKIAQSKWSIVSQNNPNNFYNFNYLNLKLPGKFKRTSLILVSPKYFLINISDVTLEVKVLEGKKKRNLLKLEKGIIDTLFNFKDENDIKISIRVFKNDYLWTPEYLKCFYFISNLLFLRFSLKKIGSYHISLRNVFNSQKIILTMNVIFFINLNLNKRI